MELGWELSFLKPPRKKVGLPEGGQTVILHDTLWFSLDSICLVWDTAIGLPSSKECVYGQCLHLDMH